MTHMRPMQESEGTFRPPEEERYTCRKCGQKTAVCTVWDSSCGGYEDYKYTCENPDCRYKWWVDGGDS